MFVTFTKQVRVGDVVRSVLVAGPFNDFAAEAIDLIRSYRPEVLVESIARLELLGIYEQCVRAGQGVAGGLVVVAEERETSVLKCGGAIFLLALEARHIIVHKL